MSKIHLPPQPLDRSPIPVCVSSKDEDTLEIDIDDPGYCMHWPNGYFQPDLPSGPVSPDDPPLILSPLVSAGTAYLAYFDSTSSEHYFFVITIQTGKC
jgi:hypothetical protein